MCHVASFICGVLMGLAVMVGIGATIYEILK